MGKKENLIKQLRPILNEQKKLEKFLIDNSNLPGPRSNLELAFALAEIFNNKKVLLEWIRITADQADVNDPQSFLAFCAAVALGKLYCSTTDEEIIPVLKQLASDSRWRMREAVAFAFQFIAENDFDSLKDIFVLWLKTAGNVEKRAILVSLAHPVALNEDRALWCFEIAEIILNDLDETAADFEVLQKGLAFTLSVFTAAHPGYGFDFLKRWIGKSKTIDRIIRENLKKKRLIRTDPDQAARLLALI